MRREVMLQLKRYRRWIVLVALTVAAGVFTGVVVAAQLRGPGPPNGLEAAVRTEPLVEVAAIPAAGGLAGHGVFVQPTSAGYICLWDALSATSGERQGGCNPTDDPFGEQKLFVSLAYDGGPGVESVTDARLVGLVAPDVADVDVLMSDGARRTIRLHVTTVTGERYRAFGYRFRKADLQRGVAPTAVLALNSAGDEIGRQTTGF
jgi:hypothetical protein